MVRENRKKKGKENELKMRKDIVQELVAMFEAAGVKKYLLLG